MPDPLSNRRRIEDVARTFNRRVPKPPAAGTLLVSDGRGGYEPVEVIRYENGDEVVFDDDDYVVLQ